MNTIKVYIVKIDKVAHSKASKILFPIIYHIETGDDKKYEELPRKAYGKPYLIDEVNFNISHSNHYWAIAFSSSECGLDIEEPRIVNESLKARIVAKNEDILEKNILNNWVLKEAYAKYLGLGLHIDFRNISTKSILETKNVASLSTKDYYCFLVSKKQACIKIIKLDDKKLFAQ